MANEQQIAAEYRANSRINNNVEFKCAAKESKIKARLYRKSLVLAMLSQIKSVSHRDKVNFKRSVQVVIY